MKRTENKQPVQIALLGSLITDGSILLITILTGALAARFLLPEGRGALAAVLFWPHLWGGLGRLSLEEAVTYRVGVQGERRSQLTSTTFWLGLGLAGLTTVAAFFLVPLLLGQGRAHLVPITRMYLLIFIPFSSVAMVLQATDQGNLRFLRYNTMRIMVTLCYLIGLLALWAIGSISVGWVAAASCISIVLVAIILSVSKRQELAVLPSKDEALSLLRLCLRFHPASILLFLSEQADKMIVLFLWNDTMLGYYVIALTVASSGLAVITESFHKVLFPHLANVRETGAQARLIAKGVRHAMLLLVGLSVLLAAVIPWVVPLLFGKEFSMAIGVAWVLVCAYVFIALKTILIRSVRGLGEGRLGSVGAAISLAVFLLLAIPLGKAMGLVGVGIALGLANLSAVGYLLNYLHVYYKLEFQDMWGLNSRTATELWTSWFRLSALPSR